MTKETSENTSTYRMKVLRVRGLRVNVINESGLGYVFVYKRELLLRLRLIILLINELLPVMISMVSEAVLFFLEPYICIGGTLYTTE